MSRKNQKPKSQFFSSETAVATAVAAALLLGILIAFLTNIQVNYVPEWKEDAEYQHMSEVWEDMARLKSNIDVLAAGLQINPDSRISMSTPIRMGGGELPVVGQMKSGGTLTINTQACGMELNITTENGPQLQEQINCGAISYQSHNSEYIDQTFCYENGALILCQNARSLMKLSPQLLLERGPSSINLSMNAISLTGSSGVLSSNAIEEIKLISEKQNPLYITEPAINVSSIAIKIYTENPEAWATYLKTSIENANLPSENYALLKNNSEVYFELRPSSGKKLNVNLYRAWIKIATTIQ